MKNLFLKKLQIKPNFKVKIVDGPENAAGIFGDIPSDVVMQYEDTVDFDALITFSTSKAQLNNQIKNNIGHIDTKTICWVFYPKKTSKIPSDLELMKSWEELNSFGLTPCASAAVNETWTALRLKFISEIKPSGVRNDHIKTNEFGDYIDPVNKTVKLPDDLQALLTAHTEAYAYFNALAYSHKKEYVLWILTAKQEKTRNNRLEKTIEMLLNRKKNPSDK